ncbi:hypothetical protein ACH5RR_039240 [Cinchona calisaya]|uniref:Uncharacterized protein n=1 Tax=Cinchona calisaya TaxID=153742 RepID=A0ABD2Y2U2_9GENT
MKGGAEDLRMKGGAEDLRFFFKLEKVKMCSSSCCSSVAKVDQTEMMTLSRGGIWTLRGVLVDFFIPPIPVGFVDYMFAFDLIWVLSIQVRGAGISFKRNLVMPRGSDRILVEGGGGGSW